MMDASENLVDKGVNAGSVTVARSFYRNLLC